ncbi:DUF5988 family protein [Actinoallomurus sp. NPDC050550]|uniref:DUF5988 family protein n=1 Tax=Actinoallomurus sp. NPDC050550 TaxID=3154937 RepID=UPI0033E50A01
MEEVISVSLQGGPPSIPSRVRIEKSQLLDGKLKIERLGGYEHFERTGGLHEDGDDILEIYRWTQRTKIAE